MVLSLLRIKSIHLITSGQLESDEIGMVFRYNNLITVVFAMVMIALIVPPLSLIQDGFVFSMMHA